MRYINNVSVWVGVLLALALFFPMALVVPRQRIFEGIDAAVMALAAGVVAGLARTAWKAMKLPADRVTAAEVLIVGIVIGATALVVIFGGLWLWRSLAKPDYLSDSLTFAFARWALAIGVFIVVATVDARDGVVAARSYRKAAFLAVASVAIVALLVSLGIG